MSRVSFDMEFLFRQSPTILYKFLTSPDCLIRWFCDEVDVTDDKFTYAWDGAEEIALLIDDIEDERLRFKWEDADTDDEYLEFRLSKSPVTAETILEITAFCDDDEVDGEKQFWEEQIKKLKRATGG